MPPASIGDPEAVKYLEALFSGTAKRVPDTELTPPESPETDTDYTDSVDIHEIDPFDKRGRARTPHLDSL